MSCQTLFGLINTTVMYFDLYRCVVPMTCTPVNVLLLSLYTWLSTTCCGRGNKFGDSGICGTLRRVRWARGGLFREVVRGEQRVVVRIRRRRRRQERVQGIQNLRHVLLHFQHVVHVSHLVVHRGLIRCVFPLPVHDELVLIHPRGKHLHDGELPVPAPVQRLPRLPVIKRPFHLNHGTALRPVHRHRHQRRGLGHGG